MKEYNLGIDVGSTTVKCVVLDKDNNYIFKEYRRHNSEILSTTMTMLEEVNEKFKGMTFKIMITGSGGLGLAKKLEVPFTQEVISLVEAIEVFIPETDVAIELGGEDAKITFLGNSSEQRMNGACAGGTGAFIDQMAQLLNVDVPELNELAKNFDNIYPIASRCGVFAKTDVQPLINEGAKLENIAASIFQAVVTQTISGLACGRPIRGKVAFLGGPLTFLSELRARFIDVLNLKEDEIIFPENSHYYVAAGTALFSRSEKESFLLEDVLKRRNNDGGDQDTIGILDPLFESKEDYDKFLHRQEKNKVKRVDINEGTGPYFLGIDAGSTTSKIALIDRDGALAWSYYGGNEGKPLENVVKHLNELFSAYPNIEIARAGVTGYGEALIKAALRLDEGEIETVAHFKGANFFLPGVDFILDIGGQDMKCLKVENQIITSIMLNEACSSGCGSFIETYAKSLNIGIIDFAKEGLMSKEPVDLGTRCTVFMNSKIKQAQKDGASISDISAGVSYSVIKNALYKVIKIKNPEELGEKIVVQGGTFYNDGVLRAFEKVSQREAVRPDIAGIMGAFGMALIARENVDMGKSTMISKEAVKNFHVQNEMKRCGLCGNNCQLTVSNFENGEFYVSGNKCERGAGLIDKEKNVLPNLFAYTYRRKFADFRPLPKELAPRGEIGIPRALNIYEHYPFWYRLFTDLGFRVVISKRSDKKIYEKGMDSIPSESLCYPAKIVNGHVKDLVESGIKNIFYPSIPYDINEDKSGENHYNCPVVTSYPEVIENNMEEIKQDKDIRFIHPFLPIYDEDVMPKRVYESLKEYYPDLGKKEVYNACRMAFMELEKVKEDIKKKGEEAVEYLRENNLKGIVLAGRPYHLDPEINHAIPSMLTQLGLGVLSEDSISHLVGERDKLRVVNQWMYHSRLYKAAEFVKTQDNLELVQLTSFGCGLDAVTSDQVKEILERHNKIYTIIKIDEINNLGAARIRARSLLAAMNARDKSTVKREIKPEIKYENFTEDMQGYTILCPQMSPVHFQFFKVAFETQGYNFELLPKMSQRAMDLALQYVNNDACYPTLVVIGQVLEAIESGKYDINKVAVLMTQTGGGCRATNYIALLKKALLDAGYKNIPIIPVTASKNLGNDASGFKITMGFLHRIIMGLVYGDVLLRVERRMKPYEKIPGSVNQVMDKWIPKIKDSVRSGKILEFRSTLQQIIRDFDNIPITDEKKIKVGIVGEILVKFHPDANNQIVDFLEKEGAEVIVPDLLDFMLYSLNDSIFKYEKLAGTKKAKNIAKFIISLLEIYRKTARVEFKKSKHFHEQATLGGLVELAKPILSIGNNMGEGWFLTAEMVELIESGVENIVCVQPFGCLPNHITGKGIIKELKNRYNYANIVPIDYDPGISETNQVNRIKLMLSKARKNMETQDLKRDAYNK